MLVDVPINTARNPVLDAVAIVNNRGTSIQRVTQGIYLTPHWSFEHAVNIKLECYPDLANPEFHAYGVCDDFKQLFAKFPELVTSTRCFVVSFVSVKRADQESSGGWRWHKWGPYIGNQDPENEYLFDDLHIDEVFTYHVYEVLEQ